MLLAVLRVSIRFDSEPLRFKAAQDLLPQYFKTPLDVRLTHKRKRIISIDYSTINHFFFHDLPSSNSIFWVLRSF